MKDLGPLKYFLGIEVARSAVDIYLTQWKYTLGIITQICLLGSKPIFAPLDPIFQSGKSKSDFFAHPEKYRRLVGKLI